MTKNSRLKDARIRSGKSQRDLAALLEVSQAYINGLENDKPFSFKKAKIIAPLIGVDADWLYFGDKNQPIVENDTKITNGVSIGKSNKKDGLNDLNDIGQLNTKLTYTENSTFPLTKELPTTNTKKQGVPYYDIDFMGGFDLVFNSQQVQPSFYIDFLPFNDCDCWINVTGKSMGPLIAHGDIVSLKRVPDWQRFLLEGEIYGVVTDNGFRTIKMIGAGPDKEHYTLIPYNKSDEYKPQVIPKEVITHIFRVKGNIKKFF